MNPKRPFDPTGLNTQTWRNIPIHEVPVSLIRFCQNHLGIEGILNLLDGGLPYGCDPYPHIVYHDETYYLDDGHHRVIIAIIQGSKTIQARVKK